MSSVTCKGNVKISAGFPLSWKKTFLESHENFVKNWKHEILLRAERKIFLSYGNTSSSDSANTISFNNLPN